MGLRLGTWNVQYGVGAERNRLRSDLLARFNADFWVLTETNDSLDLPAGYEPVHSAHRYRPETAGRWVTVWTRLPVEQRHATVDAGPTVAVTLNAGGDGSATVFRTVLPWQHDVSPDPAAAAPG